jgi:hypothetical protein
VKQELVVVVRLGRLAVTIAMICISVRPSNMPVLRSKSWRIAPGIFLRSVFTHVLCLWSVMSIPMSAVLSGVWSWVGCRGRRWESVKPRGMEEIQRRKVRTSLAKPHLHRELCEQIIYASGNNHNVGLSNKSKTSLRACLRYICITIRWLLWKQETLL